VTRESIIVAGDFHMGGGPESQSLGRRLDLFDHDVALVSFIRHLVDSARTTEAHTKLLILGDLIDFPRVRTSGRHRALSDDESIDKLQRAIESHQDVFDALSDLVAAGHNLDLVPGNHDLQLMRPPVFEALLQQFNESDRTRVSLYPWIVHIPGVLYAEHGHQYHDINSVDSLLDWLQSAPSPNDRPVGAVFDDYFVDLLARIASAQERVPVDIKDALGTLTRQPTLAAKTLPLHLHAAFRIAPALLRAEQKSRVTHLTYEISRPVDPAKLPSISIEALRAIDALASGIRHAMRRRIVRMVRSRLPVVGPRIAGQATGALARVSRGEHLREVAHSIDSILANEGREVPNYVFGHSHVADNAPLPGDPTKRVLNTGSWINRPAIDGKGPFTYIRIDAGGPGPAAAGELLRWDASQHQSESAPGASGLPEHGH
jgi:UDP-2,3-diacylglucosamine pyrophosphatase LpxH